LVGLPVMVTLGMLIGGGFYVGFPFVIDDAVETFIDNLLCHLYNCGGRSFSGSVAALANIGIKVRKTVWSTAIICNPEDWELIIKALQSSAVMAQLNL